MNQRMNSSKPKSFFLRRTTTVSLNERFSQMIIDQQTKPRTVTFDPTMPQERGGDAALQMVVLTGREQPVPLHLQTQLPSMRLKQCVRKRRSVWTRLGWGAVTRRFRSRGFWSFRNKYKQKTGLTSTFRSRGDFRRGQGQSHFMMKRNVKKPTAGKTQLSTHLQRGGKSTHRRLGRNRQGVVPTRKQLDAELDEYMSQSKRRLDQQLDEYMSQSKRRLDQQLDEYMSMAGQRDPSLDCEDTDLTWY